MRTPRIPKTIRRRTCVALRRAISSSVSTSRGAPSGAAESAESAGPRARASRPGVADPPSGPSTPDWLCVMLTRLLASRPPAEIRRDR